jgi:hypothetical protein
LAVEAGIPGDIPPGGVQRNLIAVIALRTPAFSVSKVTLVSEMQFWFQDLRMKILTFSKAIEVK